MDKKKELMNEIQCYMPRKEHPKFRGCDVQYHSFEEPKCTKEILLDNLRESKFQVQIDTKLDYPFIVDQFLRIESSTPTIDARQFDPSSIVDFDPDKILYSYCSKPGIRALKEYSLSVEGSSSETVTRDQVLHAYKEFLPENVRLFWNEMIGEDNGQKVDVDLPDTDATWRMDLKYGYQTKVKTPKQLKVYVPLVLNHREEGLDTGLFREKAVSLKGKFEKSNLIVRAQYIDGTDDPIDIPLEPLRFKIGVVNNYCKFSEELNALRLNMPTSALIPLVEVDRYEIKDLEKDLELKGHGIIEAFGISIVPTFYESHFELWDRYEELQEVCTQVPIIINDSSDPPIPGVVAVTTAKGKIPTNPLEKIGMEWSGTTLKESIDPFIYKVLQKYRMAKKGPHYRLEKINGMHMFLINEHWLSRQFSAVFNISSLKSPSLKLKFRDDLFDSLIQELHTSYTVLVHRFHINTSTHLGRTIGIRYQQ
ncbi:MAG: hypothetical protein CMM93_06940 [Rickettsiales bacterium]|nr:hypothetical protein [Rickettsiales bacterium]